MNKVAKLVYFSFCTRVVVDENMSDEDIVAMARPMISAKVMNELNENLDDIQDDIECPLDEMDEPTVFSEMISIIQIDQKEISEALLAWMHNIREFRDDSNADEHIYSKDELGHLLSQLEASLGSKDDLVEEIKKLYERVYDFPYFQIINRG